MDKKHTTLTLDGDILKKAKEQQLNISGEVNEFLRTRINGNIDSPEEELKCFVCGVHLPKQKTNDLTKGLVWLCPDERWICNSCLNFKAKSSMVAIATRR